MASTKGSLANGASAMNGIEVSDGIKAKPEIVIVKSRNVPKRKKNDKSKECFS